MVLPADMFAMALCHFTLSEGQSCETWKKTHVAWRPLGYGVSLSESLLLVASLRALHRNISAEIHLSQVLPKKGKSVSVSTRLN